MPFPNSESNPCNRDCYLCLYSYLYLHLHLYTYLNLCLYLASIPTLLSVSALTSASLPISMYLYLYLYLYTDTSRTLYALFQAHTYLSTHTRIRIPTCALSSVFLYWLYFIVF